MNKFKLFVALFLAFFSVTLVTAQTRIPSDSRLKSISSTKVIKIAYRADARPFSFVNDKNEPVGFTIDICKFVVASIERQLGVGNLKIEWVPVTVQTRFSAVASGKADMECGSSTVTLGRMKEVDFSNFVFIESTGMVVTRASNIRTFTDMAGKKIAVAAGTTNEQAIIAQLKLQKVEATVVSVKDGGAAIALLEAGNADGFASDKLLLVGAHMKNPQALVMLPDDLSVEPYAIVLPRGDWAFRLAVNTGLAQIFRTGQVVALFQGWFDRIGLQMSPDTKDNVRPRSFVRLTAFRFDRATPGPLPPIKTWRQSMADRSFPWGQIKVAAAVGVMLTLCGCGTPWGPDTDPNVVACWGYGFYPETPEFAECMKYVESEQTKRAARLRISVPQAPNVTCQTRSSGTDCQLR